MKIAVIYKSIYGTTKQYATWIAAALDAELLERSSVRPSDLSGYDMVVYGGGLYAGGIIGVDLVTKNPCRNLVIFTVGLADPETADYTKILNKNLPSGLRGQVKVFHLRGGADYSAMGIVHRSMMAMMKKMTIDRKKDSQLSDEDRAFAATYGKKVDFTNRQSILPLVQYVKNKMNG